MIISRTYVRFPLFARNGGYTYTKATPIGVYSASKTLPKRKDGQRHASKSVFFIYFLIFFQ